jgi:hypothetical protein
MHIFLTIVEREVLVEFSRVPSGAQHRRRLFVMCLECEGNAAQLLPKVPAAKSPSSKSF